MDPHSSAPELSTDPVAELRTLIQRSLDLQEEALSVSHRINELNEQLAQRRDAARNPIPSDLQAQGDR